MAILGSSGHLLTSSGKALTTTPPPPPTGLFCFAAGHSDTHPYMIWTPDVLAASPTWTNNVSGLPDRPIPGNDALSTWALDIDAPLDRVYGALYDGASGDSYALWRCDDIRHSGAWTNCLGLAAFKTLVADSTITAITVGAVGTASGIVAAGVSTTRPGGTTQYLVHSHDQGGTWTAVSFNTFYGWAFNGWVGLAISTDGATIHASYNSHSGDVLAWVRSSNGGHTLSSAYDGSSQIQTQFAPLQSSTLQTVYWGTSTLRYGGQRKTTNGGSSLSSLTPPYTDYGGALTGAPDATTTLCSFDAAGYGSLYTSTNGGSTWTTLSAAPNSVRAAKWIDSTLLLVTMAPPTILGPWGAPWIASYSVASDTYTVRDGNMSSIFGADTTARFCNIVGVNQVEVVAVGRSQAVIIG